MLRIFSPLQNAQVNVAVPGVSVSLDFSGFSTMSTLLFILKQNLHLIFKFIFMRGLLK